MPRPTWGKLVLTLAALYPPVGAFAMDWNETHIYNPRWPAHAKFHDAQTLSLSAQCAALTLWQVWKPGPDSRSRLDWAALLATLFVASQAPAILFPGTGWADPETPLQPGRKLGIPINASATRSSAGGSAGRVSWIVRVIRGGTRRRPRPA